jgi:DNA-binding NarL/FixJ family response regulator
MNIYRRLASLLGATALAGAAGLAAAATLPSDLMLPDPALAARGYVESWVFSIEIESAELKGIEACRKILVERGFLATLSKTASSASPDLHFKIAGARAYAQASADADAALQAVQQARCGGAMTWTVVSRPAPAVK